MELAEFSYTISYRSGSDSVVPDVLTRAFCYTTQPQTNISDLHKRLCHPRVTRMFYFFKSRNLPFFPEEVKKDSSNSRFSFKIEPKFYQSANVSELIKYSVSIRVQIFSISICYPVSRYQFSSLCEMLRPNILFLRFSNLHSF